MPDFSYQLYSSRNFPPLSDTLAMLSRAGYKSVEGYGALYADADKIRELKANLGSTNLTMPTGHFSIDMLEQDIPGVLAIAEALGVETIYCPYLPPDQRPTTGAGYAELGQRLAAASQPYRDAGLGFGWHNHDFELQPLADGTIPLVAIFEGGPDLEWEADIAWVVKGGGDPLRWIAALGDRITSVHMKDIAAPGENTDEDGWADLGQGTVDWKRLMAALTKTPVKHFVLEHDNPKDDARFAERSIACAKTL